MADKKISALTSASTPLAGTEVLPIVQSSSTVKVSVANLTAGRDMAATSITVGSGRTKLASTYVADVPGPTGNNTGILFGGNIIFPCDGTGTLTNGVASLGNSSYQWYDIFLANNVIIKTAAKGVNFTANTPAAGMTSQLLNWYEEGTFTPNQGAGLTVVGTFSSSGAYTRIGRQITVAGQFNATTSVSAAASAICCTNLPFSAATAGIGGMVDATISASSTCLTSATNLYVATTIAATTTIYFSVTYFV